MTIELNVGAMPSMVVVVAVNDEELLSRALLRSPDITSDHVPLVCQRGARSASLAYNDALERTVADILIFVHQDIYLPAGWIQKLTTAMARLDAQDPSWAVLGVYGVGSNGQHIGRIWSGDQDIELVGAGGTSGAARSLDEVVLVVRRAAGLRFDPGLPHFHLYGTDIVQTAIASGRTAYVVDAPVIHDTVPVASLGGGYALAYRYMQQKWRSRLPIVTTMASITRSGLPLLRARLSHWRHFGRAPAEAHPRVPDVAALARQLGYE